MQDGFPSLVKRLHLQVILFRPSIYSNDLCQNLIRDISFEYTVPFSFSKIVMDSNSTLYRRLVDRRVVKTKLGRTI
jgi:hypothetical protein